MDTRSFPGIKRQGRVVHHPPPSRWVALYHNFMACCGVTLPFFLRQIQIAAVCRATSSNKRKENQDIHRCMTLLQNYITQNYIRVESGHDWSEIIVTRRTNMLSELTRTGEIDAIIGTSGSIKKKKADPSGRTV